MNVTILGTEIVRELLLVRSIEVKDVELAEVCIVETDDPDAHEAETAARLKRMGLLDPVGTHYTRQGDFASKRLYDLLKSGADLHLYEIDPAPDDDGGGMPVAVSCE